MEKCKRCGAIMLINPRMGYKFYCIDCDLTGSKLSKREIEAYKRAREGYKKMIEIYGKQNQKGGWVR